MNGSSAFVVVWESASQDGSSSGVFGQRFDASAAKVGAEFQVNTYTSGTQNAPAVAMDDAGEFVVVWQSFGQGPNLHFRDVPVTNAFCKHIHFLWAKDVVAGCSATQYCPGLPVTRDAMAKFLGNAFNLKLYGP